jgi:hypothetical protein
MWIDSAGAFHTVALPDPTVLMSQQFRASLDELCESDQDSVTAVIERAEEQFFEDAQIEEASSLESQYAERIPPIVLIDPVESVNHLVQMIAEVDYRWRLDVIMALGDYLD